MHERSLRCLALGIAVVVASARNTIAPAFASAHARVSMSVVGDSLAVGTGASDPANAFAFRVYRSLANERPGSEVTNLAIGGSRVADVTRLQVPALDRNADLVLVIVGGNDVVRRTPTARFAADYATLVRAIRARTPRAALVVCGVPDVARSPLFADSFAKTEQLAREDDRAVRAAASSAHAAYVDLFSFTRAHGTNAEFFSSDDFHPSDAGYAELATVTLPIVERALATPRASPPGARGKP